MDNNDIVLLSYYAKVINTGGFHGFLDIQNVNKPEEKLRIQGADLIASLPTAHSFSEIEKVGITQLASKLANAGVLPFTVSFDKKDGKERILRGRLLESESLLGRSTVEDFDLPVDDRVRLVDHRTINWIIIGNKKYVLKD